MTVHLIKDSNKINIRSGVRQGEATSAMELIGTVESILRKNYLGNQRLENGNCLSRLPSAYVILVCVNKP